MSKKVKISFIVTAELEFDDDTPKRRMNAYVKEMSKTFCAWELTNFKELGPLEFVMSGLLEDVKVKGEFLSVEEN